MSVRRRNNGNPKIAIGYIRVSTDEQHLGPEAQREIIERWCRTHDIVLRAVYKDIAVSGRAPLDKRPGLNDAIDAIDVHAAGVLLVAKHDRLARDIVLAAMFHRLAERSGARILSADGTGNEMTPESEILRQVMQMFAQYEVAVIRARTKAALAAKKRRGERIGGVPYGWRLSERSVVDARTGRLRRPWLESDPAEQEVVARVRALLARGLSQREIVIELAAAGVLGRTGRPLSRTQVVRILATPAATELQAAA